MSRIEMMELFVRCLRNEATAEEHSTAEALRKASAENEKSFASAAQMLTLAKVAAAHEVREPPSGLTDTIMRKVRSNAAVNNNRRWSIHIWIMQHRSLVTACLMAVILLVLTPWKTEHDIRPPATPAVSVPTSELATTYNDTRVSNAVSSIFAYVEGSFGALCMLVCGLSAVILLVLYSRTRKDAYLVTAILLFVLACAFFLLRAWMATYFNTGISESDFGI